MINCSKHPDRLAVETCGACESPLCEECKLALEANQNSQSVSFSSGQRSRFLAFILSLVPGVGYLYLGLMKRGIQTLILFSGSIFIGDFIGIGNLSAAVIPVLMFFSIFDTQQLARRMNQGERVPDKDIFVADWFKMDYKWLGYGLIVLGVLGLLHNLTPILFPSYLIKVVFAPVAIIGLGVYILYKSTNSPEGRS